jgi:homoserine dehydrogenase
MSNKLRLGLFGFGVVGQGLYDVLHKTKGINAEVVRICVKHKDKPRPIDAGYFTFEKDDILNDNTLDVVVEMIDNADEAFDIVSTALKNGKSVVSANKKMISEHFQELYDLQRKHNVSFLYEASACGSIPVIRNLEEYYDNDLLESFEGICNGTTNYILTKT